MIGSFDAAMGLPLRVRTTGTAPKAWPASVRTVALLLSLSSPARFQSHRSISSFFVQFADRPQRADHGHAGPVSSGMSGRRRRAFEKSGAA